MGETPFLLSRFFGDFLGLLVNKKHTRKKFIMLHFFLDTLHFMLYFLNHPSKLRRHPMQSPCLFEYNCSMCANRITFIGNLPRKVVIDGWCRKHKLDCPLARTLQRIVLL
jgi:hypothetical protein